MTDVTWSIRVQRPDTGHVLVDEAADRPLPTASVGKLLLLAEVARRIEADPAYGERYLDRDAVEPVADSGVLQHLSVPALSITDLAALVGYASDNWATNLLLAEVGLDSVTALGGRLGLRSTALHDRVRRPRTAADPPALSTGSAAELGDLMARLWSGRLLTPGIARAVNRWLAPGVDLSMVAAAFGFDPLSHPEDDRGLRLVNKTGTDSGVRADVGWVTGPGGSVAYAVLAGWPREGPDRRDEVLARMHMIGDQVRTAVC